MAQLLSLTALAAQTARRDFEIRGPQVLTGLAAAALVVLCVLFHYEVMSLTSRHLWRLRLPRRPRIVALILALVLAHAVEVWFFGLAYWWLDRWPALGHLEGRFAEGALDFVYFSVVTYTTVGFGDILPQGAIRIVAGTEALVGLGLVTWSASLVFLEMQRDWAEYQRR